MLSVAAISENDRLWLAARAQDIFNGTVVVSRGVAHDILNLPGFIASDDGVPVGVAIYNIDGGQCELVSIDSFVQWRGVGTALIAAVEDAARTQACTRLWLITTNDNVDAMRFYQRRGFYFVAVHPRALEKSRILKPQIPLLGNYGIAMSDEMELEKSLEHV